VDNQSKKKQPNKWLALINIPIRVGVVIFLFAYLGGWLGEKYPNTNEIYVKIFVLIGVVLAFYGLNRQLIRVNESEDK